MSTLIIDGPPRKTLFRGTDRQSEKKRGGKEEKKEKRRGEEPEKEAKEVVNQLAVGRTPISSRKEGSLFFG